MPAKVDPEAHRRIWTAFDQGQTPNVCVVDHSTGDFGVPLHRLVDALDFAVRTHLAPFWGVGCNLYASGGVAPGCWGLALVDTSDHAAALGYHDFTADGMPLAYVFVRTALRAGTAVSVAAGHELFEMLTNPGLQVAAEGPQGGVFYAREICDPTVGCEWEAAEFPGVRLPDFVLPAWYEAFRGPRSARFDYLGRVARPFEVVGGGYAPVWAGGRWGEVFSDHDTARRFDPAEHPRCGMLNRGRGAWRLSALETCPAAVGGAHHGDFSMAGSGNRPAPKAPAKPVVPPPKAPVPARPPAAKAPGRELPPARTQPKPQQPPQKHPLPPPEELEAQFDGGEQGADGGDETQHAPDQEHAGGGHDDRGGETEVRDDGCSPESCKAQIAQMGLDWSIVGTAIGVFGPKILDMLERLIARGLTVDWVHETFQNLEPPVIAFIKDWMAQTDADGVLPPGAVVAGDGGEFTEDDPCWGKDEGPVRARLAADLLGSRVAERQAAISDSLLAFFLKTYVIDRLPEFLKRRFEGSEQSIIDIISSVLTR